jgi:hypothetical protein
MRLFGVVVAALVCQFLGWAGPATAADSDRPREVLLLYAESRRVVYRPRRVRA